MRELDVPSPLVLSELGFVCLSVFCIGYPFGEKAFEEKSLFFHKFKKNRFLFSELKQNFL